MTTAIEQAKLERAVELANQHLELVAKIRNAETRKKEIESELKALDVLTSNPAAEPDKSNMINTFRGTLTLVPGRKSKIKDKIAEAEIKLLEAKLLNEGHIIEQQGEPFFMAKLGNAIQEIE